MLELDFTPPDSAVAHAETEKRQALITWFARVIRPGVTGMLVCGSMGYGQDYSVKPSSDIDMQLLVTQQSAQALPATGCFDPAELSHALEGYAKGRYQQFSLVFKKDGVSMECHFWDEAQFMDVAAYRAPNTKRLRSDATKPSRDYAFSFDRSQDVKDYYGETVDGFAVADFNSYREVAGKLYLCRPVTNILGTPLVVIATPEIKEAIEACWRETAARLRDAGGAPEALETLSVTNALPGRNKMSPSALERVRTQTLQYL